MARVPRLVPDIWLLPELCSPYRPDAPVASFVRFCHVTHGMSDYRWVTTQLQGTSHTACSPGSSASRRRAVSACTRRHDSEQGHRGMATLALALSSGYITQNSTMTTPPPGRSGFNGTLGRFGCGLWSYRRRVRWATAPDPLGPATARSPLDSGHRSCKPTWTQRFSRCHE